MTKDTILERLRAGESMDDIMSEITSAANEAEAAYAEEQKKEKYHSIYLDGSLLPGAAEAIEADLYDLDTLGGLILTMLGKELEGAEALSEDDWDVLDKSLANTLPVIYETLKRYAGYLKRSHEKEYRTASSWFDDFIEEFDRLLGR